MALTVSIGAAGAEVDLTAYLVDDTLRVEQRADAFVSTASFSLVDETGTTLTVKEKDSVLIADGATKYFSGVIANLDAINIADGPESLEYEIECQDYNVLLEEATIYTLEEFPNGVNPARDDTVIDYLFDAYLPEIDSHAPGAGGYVQHLHTFAEIKFENITLREAMDMISTEVESVALEGYWYVDYNKALHYFNIEDNAPAWGLSDNPDDVTTFSYFAAVRKSRQGAAIANRILVVGADVALFVQDLDSYAYYGKWFETVVRENTLESVAEIIDYGNSLLARWAYPDEVFTVTTYKAGLRAGMNVEFTNTLFGTRTRKNWIKNPSFENNCTDGWTFSQGGAGGSAAADATRASPGAKSCKLIASDAGNSTLYTDAVALAIGETVTVQARLYRATDIGANILIYDTTNSLTRATGTPNATAIIGTWEFLTISWTNNTAGAVNVHLFLNNTEADGAAAVWYDGCGAEIDKGEYSLEYIDGTLPYCDWDGAAHNSTSTRSPVYTVRQMTITWPKGVAEYKLTLGGKVTSSALIASRSAKDASDAGKGPVVPGQLPTSSRGWSHNLIFGGIGIDHNTMPWGAGTLTTTGGVTYSIGAGDTGDMGAGNTTYIYLDTDVSLTVLQTSLTAPTGAHKILVAIANPQVAGMLATVIVYGGGEGSGLLVDTERIVDGAITAVKAGTTLQGWSQAVGFSATDNDTVAWAGGDLEMADGTTYVIGADDTGNMVARTYIYFDLDIANNALQHNIDPAVAVGNNKILVAVAEDVADAAKKAYLQAYGGDGTSGIITGDQVVANTITVTELAADSITTVKLVALNVTGAKIAAATITAGKLVANTITASQMAIGGFGDLIFDTAGGLLLLGPHCEISATTWTSLRQQTATISGAFHQVAGRWLGTKALVVEPGVTNEVGNPSVELAMLWWAEQDADASMTVTRSNDRAYAGDYSIKLVNADAGDDDFEYFDLGGIVADTVYTISAWVYVDVFTAGAILDRGLGAADLNDVAGTEQYTTITAVTAGWVRHVVTITTSAAPGSIRARCYGPQGTVYWDALQIEKGAYATSYCDGTLGAGYAWGNGAHASASTRTVTEVNLDAHVKLLDTNNTVSHRLVVQMPYDHDGDWPTEAHFIDIPRGVDDNKRVLFHYEPGSDTFKVRINAATRLESTVQGFEAGDWLDIVITLDFTANDFRLYINGVLEDDDQTALAAFEYTQWNLGSHFTGVAQCMSAIAEYAVFDRVLTLAEVESLYMLGRPLGDSGAFESPGIYILDGRFTIASSTGTTRIEITADQIAGYNAGTRQFYLSAVDGKAYFAEGDIVLDEDGITITAENSIENTIKWKAGAVSYTSISSYQAGIQRYTYIKTHGPADTGHEGIMFLSAQGAVTQGDSYIQFVSERVGQEGYMEFWVGHDGAAVQQIQIDPHYVRVLDRLTAHYGLYVGNKDGVPGSDMIYCDSDIRTAGGLSVGSLATNPDPGDIIASGDIFVGGIIETAYDIGWNLGFAQAIGTWVADYKIRVTLDGNDFDIAAELV